MQHRLNELFHLQMGKTPSREKPEYWEKGTNKWISISDLSNCSMYTAETKETITDCAVRETNIRLVPKNTVIMSFKLSIGKTAITSEPVYTNEAIMAFVNKDEKLVLPEFLYYQLLSKDWGSAGNRAVMGATLNKASLSQMKINVPSLQEQQGIVQVLSQIDSQLKKADESVNKLDGLVKSRFVEMFGALLKNGKGQTLEDISELITVGIANAATHAYADKGTIMFRNLNIHENHLDDTDLITIRPEFAEKYKKKALKSGDILVTRTGYPGVACIVPEKYAGCQTFTTLIVRLDTRSGASATFVSQYINSPLGKEYVNKMKAGSSQQNFGATSLKSMPIVVPPLALQQEFADFVFRVDKLRFATQQQIEKLETLKRSLMQEYFG